MGSAIVGLAESEVGNMSASVQIGELDALRRAVSCGNSWADRTSPASSAMGAILAAVSLSESDALRRVFEGVVAMCIAAGLVGGEAAFFSAIDGAKPWRIYQRNP